MDMASLQLLWLWTERAENAAFVTDVIAAAADDDEMRIFAWAISIMEQRLLIERSLRLLIVRTKMMMMIVAVCWTSLVVNS